MNFITREFDTLLVDRHTSGRCAILFHVVLQLLFAGHNGHIETPISCAHFYFVFACSDVLCFVRNRTVTMTNPEIDYIVSHLQTTCNRKVFSYAYYTKEEPHPDTHSRGI